MMRVMAKTTRTAKISISLKPSGSTWTTTLHFDVEMPIAEPR